MTLAKPWYKLCILVRIQSHYIKVIYKLNFLHSVKKQLLKIHCQFSSVQFSRSVMSNSLRSHESQHVRPPCPSPTPGVHSNSYPLSWWCHSPFSSCRQYFPASGSFQMSQFFIAGGQSIGVSASVSVLPINIQDWFPLGWAGWISLPFKGLSSIFSNTTV